MKPFKNESMLKIQESLRGEHGLTIESRNLFRDTTFPLESFKTILLGGAASSKAVGISWMR